MDTATSRRRVESRGVTLGGLGEASQSCQSKKKQRGFAGLFHAMRASLDTNTTRM